MLCSNSVGSSSLLMGGLMEEASVKVEGVDRVTDKDWGYLQIHIGEKG